MSNNKLLQQFCYKFLKWGCGVVESKRLSKEKIYIFIFLHSFYLESYLHCPSYSVIADIYYDLISVCSVRAWETNEQTVDKVIMIKRLMKNWLPLHSIVCILPVDILNFSPNAGCFLSSRKQTKGRHSQLSLVRSYTS